MKTDQYITCQLVQSNSAIVLDAVECEHLCLRRQGVYL
jgi:hypothetical protein